jgi:hypothetical protein
VTMSDDPWKGIKPPSSVGVLNSRRVDAEGRWDFFWARGMDRRCLLVLRHSVDAKPAGRLPRVKGIEVALAPGVSDDDAWALTFRLEDAAHRDIFHHLCRDIVSSADNASSEPEAVSRALARTWRWHHLLRGGKDGRLSEEEQRGLMGELLVLEERLLPNLSPLDAVAAWRGPLGAPKDFEVDRVSLEVKARRGAARPFISISSEHQLDASGSDQLFLQVVEVDRALVDSSDGESLTHVATRIRDHIASRDPGAVSGFEAVVNASGFKWEADYSDALWVRGGSSTYQVDSDFPGISAGQLATGITNVRYALSLQECEPFLVGEDSLPQSLRLFDAD